MKYKVFIKEFVDKDEFELKETPIGLILQHLPNGNIRVGCLIPDYTGIIV